MSDRNHLIQYRDPESGQHESMVLCWAHETMLLGILKETKTGCVSTTAPILSRCDGCENEVAA